MPGYFTHYIYGILGLRKAGLSDLDAMIRRHGHAYAFGLVGPDFFLFSLMDLVKYGENTGTLLHEERTGAFLQNMLKGAWGLSGNAREIGVAYCAGFLCHYALDCHCHPLVYARTGDEEDPTSLGRHFAYESAMDVYAARSVYRKRTVDLSYETAVALEPAEQRIIETILLGAICRTYPGRRISRLWIRHVIFHYQRTVKHMRDASGRKERRMRAAEQVLLGYPVVSPLWTNGNTYGYAKDDWRIFLERIRQALQEIGRLLGELEKVVSEGGDAKALFALIGSRSYHTGEPV